MKKIILTWLIVLQLLVIVPKYAMRHTSLHCWKKIIYKWFFVSVLSNKIRKPAYTIMNKVDVLKKLFHRIHAK